MKAIIKYTDTYADKKIVYGILSQFNTNIIKTYGKSWSIYSRIILQVEDRDEINNILYILNRNTVNGVELVSCRYTLTEIIQNLFKERDF